MCTVPGMATAASTACPCKLDRCCVCKLNQYCICGMSAQCDKHVSKVVTRHALYKMSDKVSNCCTETLPKHAIMQLRATYTSLCLIYNTLSQPDCMQNCRELSLSAELRSTVTKQALKLKKNEELLQLRKGAMLPRLNGRMAVLKKDVCKAFANLSQACKQDCAGESASQPSILKHACCLPDIVYIITSALPSPAGSAAAKRL